MVVNHFSHRTILSYSAAIKRLFAYYNQPLQSLLEDKLVGFVCSLKEDNGLSAASMRIAVSAIKYFYRYILHQKNFIDEIPYPKKEQHIKIILSGSEVKQLMDLTENLKHRLILKVLYSGGLRRSEVLALRPFDFDWKNMQLTIHQGKGKKDRQTVLAKSLHSDYLAYVNQYAPEGHFFFGRNKSVPASESMLRWIMDQAVSRAGITKKVHLHTLRHSFASHLLSINTDIVTVQHLLGHDDIRTTMAYLHLNHRPNAAPRSPMDIIYK